MDYRNPEIPEGINVSDTHPLKEFALLGAAVIAGVLIIVLLAGLSVDWLAGFIPFEYEKRLIEKFEPRAEARNSVDDYLQTLADGVAQAMELPAGMRIRIHYVNEDTVNAFATFGGHVMVFRGLLEKLPDENALVMLIGHEVAHVKLRHPLRAMGKGLVLSTLLGMVLGQSSDSLNTLLGNAGMMTVLSFSRAQEEDADEEGLKAVWRRYHHVAGALALYRVLQENTDEGGEAVPQLLRSHPRTAARITHLQRMLEARHWSQQGERRPIPGFIRQKLAADRAAVS